eukprot:Lithocolla_globosa_v1_NODE_3101_length_1766_cov_23.507890.p2 type:complete len:147 gc:universal NODE_3101_length_1766_cov_23.507890:1678-1238(-)
MDIPTGRNDILTNHDLEAVFQGFRGFRGVVPHDKIPKLKNNEFVIINLDDSDGKGSHWVAGYRRNGSYYFDPFGIEPDDRTIRALGRPVQYNTSQLQDIKSQRCGWYVMKWLYEMLRGKSFYDSLYDEFTQAPSAHNERLGILRNP